MDYDSDERKKTLGERYSLCCLALMEVGGFNGNQYH